MKSPFTITSVVFAVSSLFSPIFLIFLPVAVSVGLAIFALYKKEPLRHLTWTALVLGGATSMFFPIFAEHYYGQQIKDARTISEQTTISK